LQYILGMGSKSSPEIHYRIGPGLNVHMYLTNMKKQQVCHLHEEHEQYTLNEE